MPFYFFQWTEEAIQHNAEHGVTQDEFTEVVMDARVIQASRSTGLPLFSGRLPREKGWPASLSGSMKTKQKSCQ
jgi:hypothetical protein